MPYGPQAQAFMAQFILGRMVQMEPIGSNRYRRKVATLPVDGPDMELTLLWVGSAWNGRHFSAPGDAMGLQATAPHKSLRRSRLTPCGPFHLPSHLGGDAPMAHSLPEVLNTKQ